MFAFRDAVDLGPGTSRVEVAFTNSSIDLQGEKPGFAAALAEVVAVTGVPFARLSQVHGDDVVIVVDDPPVTASDEVPVADALVTARRRIGLMVRVADCVPVLLADPDAGVVAAVHAGRAGVALDIVTRAVEQMHVLGGRSPRAWVGPHVCGRCYEVPAEMREEVATAVPSTYAETRSGSPSLDLGAGVMAQLTAAGVAAEVVGGCTLEEQRFHSHRRDGATAGRLAGLVWVA